jgi:hypothetical protein
MTSFSTLFLCLTNKATFLKWLRDRPTGIGLCAGLSNLFYFALKKLRWDYQCSDCSSHISC